ncbi:hypothetical protein DICVIV_10089 [Dictyocaulus viviparus]|uniref:Ras family protein n=1 Tax=Dictyocaulus viviparus TaxID=29172 RepID=A0A0D8XJA8_DICVI|nr:hypothetical protein DICVIV_10089 [Dictyocaulus viviparus]
MLMFLLCEVRSGLQHRIQQFSFCLQNSLIIRFRGRSCLSSVDFHTMTDENVDNSAEEVVLKVVVCGDGSSGKTSLCERFVKDTFDRSYHQHIYMYKYIVRERISDTYCWPGKHHSGTQGQLLPQAKLNFLSLMD